MSITVQIKQVYFIVWNFISDVSYEHKQALCHV